MGIGVRAEGKKVNSNINVTPMVDVMLVLLIIFMVITPLVSNKVNVDLPKVTAATIMENASKEDAIVVAVTRDGKTFVGGDAVPMDNIGTRIADLISRKTAADADKTVYFRADARANYGRVMDVIDAIRTSGTSQLGLLTDTNNQDQ